MQCKQELLRNVAMLSLSIGCDFVGGYTVGLMQFRADGCVHGIAEV